MSHHDPGWNDPPTFSYSGNVGPKRTLLNKRVSFPVTPAQSTANCINSPFPVTPISLADMNGLGFLPLMPPTVPISKLEEKDSLNEMQDSGFDLTQTRTDEEMLSFVHSVFNAVISKIPQDSEFLVERKIEDIKSRLKSFEEMWAVTLSLPVKQRMFKLAEALFARNYKEADALHCNLIVDHVSEVSQWMVAVKHIIQIARTLDES